MTPEEAEALTYRIVHEGEKWFALVVTAWRERVWEPLGLESWQAYTEQRLGRLRAIGPDRAEMVAALRSEGMSTRAIASAVGTSKDTVQRDLSTVSNETVEQPQTVTSLDGRVRPATRPPSDPYEAGQAAADEAIIPPVPVPNPAAAAARKHQEEIEHGWRTTNTGVAEAVRTLAAQGDGDSFFRAFYPHHDTYVHGGMRLRLDKIRQAQAFLARCEKEITQ